LALCILIPGCFLVSGCSTEFDEGEARDVAEIKINEGARTRGVYGYSPNPITVAARTEIIWTNMDTVPHRVTSSGGFFESDGVIEPNETYSFIFSEIGYFRYYCAIPGHREEGTINVTP
jgi:plastocyanin